MPKTPRASTKTKTGARAVNIEKKHGHVWQWIAGILATLLVGLAIADRAILFRHTSSPGHDVMLERVARIEAAMILALTQHTEADDALVLELAQLRATLIELGAQVQAAHR